MIFRAAPAERRTSAVNLSLAGGHYRGDVFRFLLGSQSSRNAYSLVCVFWPVFFGCVPTPTSKRGTPFKSQIALTMCIPVLVAIVDRVVLGVLVEHHGPCLIRSYVGILCSLAQSSCRCQNRRPCHLVAK